MGCALFADVTLSRDTPSRCQTEHWNARTGQPAVLLQEYRPQLENQARHRGTQPRRIPASHLADALRVLRAAALLATYRIPSSAHTKSMKRRPRPSGVTH